jgi:hypothetical protein
MNMDVGYLTKLAKELEEQLVNMVSSYLPKLSSFLGNMKK